MKKGGEKIERSVGEEGGEGMWKDEVRKVREDPRRVE